MNGLRKALRCWPWLAAATTGAMATLSLPPFDQTWLCWIALTPLLAALWFSGEETKRRWRRDLLLGYIAGLVFFWWAFSWLTTVTGPGWFLVGGYMGVYFAIWAWVAGLVRPAAPAETVERTRWAWPPLQPNESPLARSPWLSSARNLGLSFLLAAAWTALEWVRSWMFSGWGWNGLGSALHGVLPMIQIAEFTGVFGISFVVAFVNVIAITTVRRVILEAQVARKRPHFDFTLTMAALVTIAISGLRVMQDRPATRPLRIAAVQANVPREDKFYRPSMQKVFDQFERLTKIARATEPSPDLIMWPESSMPGPVLVDEDNYQFVMKISATIDSDLLLGTIDQDKDGAYNAALLVSEKGAQVQLYRKLHLVPYGEYVPFRHSVPFIARIVGDQVPDDFVRGKEHTIFRLTKTGTQIAPLICFEDTIGELTRQFVLRGATLLANVTNDGWFLRSAGSRQHLANAVFRCIETRRPMARAANTGVTCFVNQFGRVTQELVDEKGSQFTEGVLTGEVGISIAPQTTFYTQHGELFAEVCGGVLLAFLAWQSLKLVRRTDELKDVPAVIPSESEGPRK